MKPSRASPPWLGCLIGSPKNRKSRNEWDVLYVFCNSMSRSRTWSLKYHTSQKPAPSGEFLEEAVLTQRKSTVLYFESSTQLKQRSVTWLQSTRQSVWASNSESFFVLRNVHSSSLFSIWRLRRRTNRCYLVQCWEVRRDIHDANILQWLIFI